jgi:hypothetical protein
MTNEQTNRMSLPKIMREQLAQDDLEIRHSKTTISVIFCHVIRPSADVEKWTERDRVRANRDVNMGRIDRGRLRGGNDCLSHIRT